MDSGNDSFGEKRYSEHLISAGNIVLGVYRFIKLKLPDGWVVRRSEIPPEIVYTSEINGVSYVAEGISYNYISHVLGDEGFQLKISCRKRSSVDESEILKRLKGRVTGTSSVSSHRSYFYIGEKRFGVFRKRSFNYAKVVFFCDVTRRLFEVEILGTGSIDHLRSILKAIESSQCHEL